MFGKKKASTDQAAKPKETNKASTSSTTTNTGSNTANKLVIQKREQEIRREAYLKEQEEKRQRLLEEQRIKQEKEKEHRKKLKQRQLVSMITFCIGLFVMVTALICLFPTTEIIVFSTLLMFTFFFLGIAYQRLVMQLLVLALTCMLITGAFYTIMINS